MAWPQVIGISLLAALPVADLYGVLGVREHEASASSATLGIEARYPDPARFRNERTLELRVTNPGNVTLEQVNVLVDDSYLAGFSRPRATPLPLRVTDTDLEFTIPALAPGQTRRILIDLQPEHYGRHSGRVVATAAGAARAAVTVSTFVLP